MTRPRVARSLSAQLLLGLSKRHAKLLAGGCSLMLIESMAVLSLPWLAGRAAAQSVSGTPGEAPQVALLLGAAAFYAALRWGSAFLLGMAGVHLVTDIRSTVHQRLHELPLIFHQSTRRGELMALLTFETGNLAQFLSGTLAGVLPAVVTAAGAIILMLQIDAKLGLMVAGLVPVFFVFLRLAARPLRHLAVQQQRAEAEAVATADENLELIATTKGFGREPERNAVYQSRLDRARDLAASGVRAQGLVEPGLLLIALVGAILLGLQLTGSVIDNGLDTSRWVSFALYGVLLTRPISTLGGIYGQIQVTRGTMRHLDEVLAAEPEILGSAPAARGQRANGSVRFEHVTFSYPGRARVLDGFDLSIPAGSVIGLTGENGAGKSTLVHLLMRFFDPDSGRVLLDGKDIRSMELAQLRAQIAIVPQRVQLWSASVRENIAFGDPAASQEQIRRAARLAQAEEFIDHLPQGYDTRIGDDGVRLSGGQRQRLALARALLKNAPILILDEPTAMFDPRAEEDFVRAMQDSAEPRTIILITHRPASLQLADLIVELSQGKLRTFKPRHVSTA